jgi:hypothetical protein
MVKCDAKLVNKWMGTPIQYPKKVYRSYVIEGLEVMILKTRDRRSS